MVNKPKTVKNAGDSSTRSVSQGTMCYSAEGKVKPSKTIKNRSSQSGTAESRVDSATLTRADRRLESDERRLERNALERAYLGVKRLTNRSRARGAGKPSLSVEAVAAACDAADRGLAGAKRGRLLASPSFDISWDRDGEVAGSREDVQPEEMRSLFGNRFKPAATLDLHGMVGEEAKKKVAAFVIAQHERGVKQLLFIHGKGKHSESGVGVLLDHLVKALTRGTASQYVRAFCTADLKHGGGGALAVLLIP
ncbi:MAG: Smr/MutS family protein [Deltaproteobacteria bacterium]|nr:Smr/MutS family protein [Deltaproteobacteria bacterium]